MPNPQKDPRDFSGSYNTQLTPAEEKQYASWVQKIGHTGDTYDYDMRGAWKAGAGQADNGHFPDTFKKPNHPSFSVESQYSGGDNVGGQWTRDPNGRDRFIPGPANMQHRSAEELMHYFLTQEPGVNLGFPPPPPLITPVRK